ncbi:hypothetical protein GINT2_001260 [Glugoides intestinalis]
MKCEVCGTLYKKIDTLLVCENGHTIQNATMVSHENMIVMGKSKRIYKKKTEKVRYPSTDCKLFNLVLLKLLFEEARTFFGIKEATIFRYFTEFFDFNTGKLHSSVVISKTTFSALIYMAKRVEMERSNQLYSFADFIKKFESFSIASRLLLIKNKFPVFAPEVAMLNSFFSTTMFTILSLKTHIDELTNLYTYTKPYAFTNLSETGIFEESNENAKYNIRRLFRNDLDIMTRYLKKLCETLKVDVTDDLILYFEKFTYVFDKNTVLFPEHDITFFIVTYLASKDMFENSDIEEHVLEFLGICKSHLIMELSHFVYVLDEMTSPETYINYLDKKNRRRFDNLKGSVEFVNAYKRLVALDMKRILDRKTSEPSKT